MKRRRRPPVMAYVPAGELNGRPHIVVDGAPRPGTVCTLSHWPGTPTPRALWGDVSAEIVRNALAARRWPAPGVDAVTVDHYDADGVISLGLLVHGDLADAHGALLARAAHVGDFDVVGADDLDAARIAFALGAVPGDVETSCEPDAGADQTARWAARALTLLPGLAAAPGEHEALWGPELAAFLAARRALEAGAVVVEERREVDLAVVRVDDTQGALDGAGWEGAVVHPAAIHSATACMRVAVLVGHRYELHDRYETWVRLASRRPRPRVDLELVAAALARLEPGEGRWEAEGPGSITPSLHMAGGDDSALSPEAFVEAVCEELARLDDGPPAWDPYSRPVGDARF
ncbi:MAG: DUF6687 family protein [Acidimicrobiales bacterium]